MASIDRHPRKIVIPAKAGTQGLLSPLGQGWLRLQAQAPPWRESAEFGGQRAQHVPAGRTVAGTRGGLQPRRHRLQRPRANGERRAVERAEPALVLLDLGLPGEDGFSLARHLRQSWPRIGIIMVTAASDTIDRVVGLETGADDYIAKPFEPRELLARDWLLEATSHREAEAFDRAIDLRVTRLRRKIERDPAHPEAIRTVRGVGCMFVPTQGARTGN